MKSTTRFVQTAIGGLIVCALAFAGPLVPSNGPIASTYKTLAEVEPRVAVNATNTPGDGTCMFRISQPGSYYVSGNIVSAAGKAGVLINSSGVTLDLAGFTISGGSTGLSSTFGTSQIAVRNGHISGTTQHGIDLTNSSDLIIDRVTVEGVPGSGIATGGTAHISDCNVVGGANAFSVGSCAVLERCVANNATGNGFRGAGQARLLDCVASNCSGMGYQFTGNDGRFTNCTAFGGGTRGFEVGPYSLIDGCVSNGGGGIGFNVGTGSTIRNCIAENNALQGIVALGGVSVLNNQIRYGPAGIAAIWLQGTQCRADGNDVTAYGYGVFTNSVSHIIIRNAVTGATTQAFHIAPNNVVGTIVSPAVTANSIGGATGGGVLSTDTNANYVY